jgi:hypothetical protein
MQGGGGSDRCERMVPTLRRQTRLRIDSNREFVRRSGGVGYSEKPSLIRQWHLADVRRLVTFW